MSTVIHESFFRMCTALYLGTYANTYLFEVNKILYAKNVIRYAFQHIYAKSMLKDSESQVSRFA